MLFRSERTLLAIRQNIIPLIIAIFAGSGGEDSFINLTYAGIFMVLLLGWGVISWMRFIYRVKDGALFIHQGVLVRKETYLPKDRIQLIDVRSSFLQRMFGLVSVRVQTAAGEGAEKVEINSVTKEEAEVIRKTLRKKKKEETEFSRTQTAGTTADSHSEKITEEPDANEEKELDTISLPAKHLVIAGLTSGSFGIAFSILGTLFSQLDTFISDSEIKAYLESFIRSDEMFIITIIALMLVASLILSFAGTLIRYSRFRVTRYEEELVVERGLFERITVTIPYHRIQSLRFKEGIMRQPFGFGTLYIDSAGYAGESGQSNILFPLIPRNKVATFIHRFLPDYEFEMAAAQPPARSLRRFLIPKIIFLAILEGLLYYFTDLWIIGIVAVPLALYLGYLQYRDAAFAFNRSGDAIFRYRSLARVTAIAGREKLQQCSFAQNPFQRRSAVGNIEVTVVSGREGRLLSVPHLDISTLEQFWRLMATSNQEMFSWKSKAEYGPVRNGWRTATLPGWHYLG